MDWPIDTAMEDVDIDDESDDENEIRQLEAALEEAEIKVCDTGLPKASGYTFSRSASQISASPRSAIPSCTSSVVGTPRHDFQSTSSPPSTSPYSTPQLQELSNITSALALNKLYEEKLLRLERILTLRLRECRAKLNDIQGTSEVPERVEVFRYVNCGRPYFRDQNNRTAPDNPDTVTSKAQMYDFSLVTSVPGWTVRDKNKFTEVMTKVSLEMRKEKYNEKILELKSSLTSKQSKSVENEIAKLRIERNSLNLKMPFLQLALPLDEEYNWDTLVNKLNRRHTAHEYRCLWKLYFHPSINKTSWKNSEHNALQAIAAAHHFQDWDEIAKKLNTGRTGYQCFVYFRTNITNSCIGKKWTHEEVTYLKRLIEYFKEDLYIPWGKIAAAMENRTKIQIYNKYMRLIEQRKGRFLPEEDAVILNCVDRFGTNFRKMTDYLAHRSLVQIRARYNILKKIRVSTVWSVEDDKKLIQIMSNQDSNMNFSAATKFFPGRSRENMRSRYTTLIKWMKKYPNLALEHAPRRGARRLNHGQATDDLNKAIENLKDTLNKEVTVKKDRKKITRESEETDIEDAIIAALVNECVKEQELLKSTFDGVSVLPNEMVVSNRQLDLTNLRKCLIYLASQLDKTLFYNSHFSEKYPKLGESDQDVSLVKIKSYSKINTVKTITYNDNPDIWGTNALTPRDHVLPPNYATITGCKALMSHVAAYGIPFNVHVLIRRNRVLKEQMDHLLERFYTLFLWPMLLSNEGPSDILQSKLRQMDANKQIPVSIEEISDQNIPTDLNSSEEVQP